MRNGSPGVSPQGDAASSGRMDFIPWIALNTVDGVGRVLYKRLILRFGSPEKVFAAQKGDLIQVEGMGPKALQAIKDFKDWEKALNEAEKAKALGVDIVTFTDPRYPQNLKEIHDPPPYLYVKGNLAAGDKIAVAMVGSRQASHYGLSETRKIAADLSAKGITVVSGGARGIDTEAHRGALSGGGRTIAVLGCGIDVTYPRENGELFKKVAENGAVVTEYPVGTPPDKANFPPRNRIISGISLGVIVMEAAKDSGSLITASYSVEQGREVYALPGNVSSDNSRGVNTLIKKGAKLIEGPGDVLEDLLPYMKGYLSELDLDYGDAPKSPAALMPSLAPDETAVYEHISLTPLHVDIIAEKTGFPVSKTLSVLLDMELKGVIRQISGMNYIKEI
ncbi:MAG: DNA-processing protein DprA [Nitrospirota bacterium]